MPQLRVVPVVRQRLGDDGTEALNDMVIAAGREWQEDVLTTVANRFEARLTQEISTLRVDVTKELATMRVEIIRWSFVFRITQLAAMAGLVAYMK